MWCIMVNTQSLTEPLFSWKFSSSRPYGFIMQGWENLNHEQCCGSGSTCFWASWILLSLSKNKKKNLNFYCFVTSFLLLIFVKWCKVPSKSNMQKNFFLISVLLASWRSTMKIKGSGSASGSESISERHGSADPDQHQNVMDSQHWSWVQDVYPTRCVPLNMSKYPSMRQEKKTIESWWIHIHLSCGLAETDPCSGSENFFRNKWTWTQNDMLKQIKRLQCEKRK